MVTGSYAELENAIGSEIKEGSIQWSHHAWEDEKGYFNSFLQEAIQNYEKRYRTTVSEVVLAGTVGLWNGSPVGGRIVNMNHSILEQLGDVDVTEVYADTDGAITLHGLHHDGMHRMQIYLLTERKFSAYMNHWHESPEFFEAICKQEKPLSIHMAKGYFSVDVAS